MTLTAAQRANVEIPIVNPTTFVVATRDSGYRDLASAIAELVDNSIDATASAVQILIDQDSSESWRIAVLDNGVGLDLRQLTHALQFGGTHRFNSRVSIGRFGMGLPNASLSQARSVDIYTWGKKHVFNAQLDVDRIVAGVRKGLIANTAAQIPDWLLPYKATFTTAVVWSNCDRISYRRESSIARLLKNELGRTYRSMLGRTLSVRVNNEDIISVDPVRMRPSPKPGAVELLPLIEIPFAFPGTKSRSTIAVQFSSLPIEHWSHLSNAAKREFRITKWSGVSVLREGREISYGWHFLGTKRRENYDDWWRCEVQFPATLDEAFGVTHNKQGLHPSAELLETLVPIISSQAYRLNRQVRHRFAALRRGPRVAELRAASRDNRIKHVVETKGQQRKRRTRIISSRGHRYRIEEEDSSSPGFIRPVTRGEVTIVYLNRLHPFFTAVYEPVAAGHQNLELSAALNGFVLAMGRAVAGVRGSAGQQFIRRLSDLAALFMEPR